MKRLRNSLGLIVLFTLLGIAAAHETANGQVPPPPPPNGGTNNGHGLGGNQGPAGAPIGNGSEILIILGVLYAGRKLKSTADIK